MAHNDTSIAEHFASIPDPRIERGKQHSLHDIFVITICATICGADGWVAVEVIGKAKEKWLRGFLELPNGIPSHDTFGRVFAALDPDAFRACFVNWAAAVTEIASGEIVAVDGKTLRRSYDRASGKSALHMVNAWASEAGIALGQLATEEKSNEITAIPRLLDLLALKGCIVTTDAMGCQKAIAEKIIDKEADYVLALKGNQGTLHKEVEEFFEWARQGGPDVPKLIFTETIDGDHGRIEIRRYWISDDVSWFADKDDWKDLRTFAMVESERTLGEKTSVETRHYISSLAVNKSEDITRAIRKHWGVENGLHWVLDVSFHEDDCRVRTGYAAENLGIVRQIALNLLKKERSEKVGVVNKRLKAACDDSYLLKVLGF